MRFKEEVVLVTGSSRGIGRAIALAFAKEGATVILNSGYTKEKLLTTYHEFLELGLDVHYYFGDLSDFKVCEELFHFIVNTVGKSPTIVINNAGISHSGLFTDTSPDVWQRIMNVNVNTTYNCSYLATPSMISNKKGIIINISSIWGTYGASCEVAYSTSKSAIHGFTKSLAKELGPSNVRINAIACGWIDTDMTAIYTEEDKAAFTEEIPLMRTGKAEEVANTCLFLASNDSSYMTGQIVTLDGGMY